MLKEDTNALKKLYDTDLLVNAPFNAVTSGSSIVFRLVQTGFIKLSSYNIEIEKVIGIICPIRYASIALMASCTCLPSNGYTNK